jgi:hypothetical protein
VAGVRLVGAADQTVPVWALTEDLGPGATLAPESVEMRAVRFGEEGDLARYLRADEPLPDGSHLVRGVGAGELLPAAAVGTAEQSGVVQVPIRVPADGVPPSIEVGSRVDVYVSDETAADRPAELLLGDVAVAAAPRAADTLGTTGNRQLVLSVAVGDRAVTRLVAASAAGILTVVGRG